MSEDSHINWNERATLSELAFSKALLSEPVEYPGFVHLYNRHVSWGGDFNRALKIRFTGIEAFECIAAQIEQIHQEKGLDKPNRYDISPPALDEIAWKGILQQHGFRLQTAIFFQSSTKSIKIPAGFELYNPSRREYFDWYVEVIKRRGYYDADWFEELLPLQTNFIQVFKPYWLLKADELVGWVYCSNLGDFCRLFEVEVDERYRGQGMGRILLQAITQEGYQQGAGFMLLQTSEPLRPFYEKCGFEECARYSIIRVIHKR